MINLIKFYDLDLRTNVDFLYKQVVRYKNAILLGLRVRERIYHLKHFNKLNNKN